MTEALSRVSGVSDQCPFDPSSRAYMLEIMSGLVAVPLSSPNSSSTSLFIPSAHVTSGSSPIPSSFSAGVLCLWFPPLFLLQLWTISQQGHWVIFFSPDWNLCHSSLVSIPPAWLNRSVPPLCCSYHISHMALPLPCYLHQTDTPVRASFPVTQISQPASCAFFWVVLHVQIFPWVSKATSKLFFSLHFFYIVMRSTEILKAGMQMMCWKHWSYY